ncbi:hypothetical protein HPB52_003996 [Rhipicephalus sanguineus]|uniref:Peptidase M13 N-terminal domain-containing protein n=1 Tax=Rhipicephalus sanguineus TaxID=34632 RepID=A0A9D4SRX9_RHISA|nr:hypothetical protein HPB52_003996 [Rhipicephalus sanguineus]
MASTASISSTQLVLPDGVPDEDFVATNPDVALRRRTLYEDTGPLFAEPRSQPSQSKAFELGFEDLCCYDAAKPHPRISATIRKPTATPRSRNTPPELAAEMGDAACLVALSSQRRRKNSSCTTLRARDGESLGSRTRGGGTSRARTDATEEEPSVEVTWRTEIRPIEGQHSSGKQAMPVLARQKKSPIPSGEPDATNRVPLSVTSTSTRKPPAAREKEGASARPADKRQGLKIDISFGKSPGPDKDGKLLKSISTNVEKIVARLLSRCGEDRQPLSGVDDSETSVIELDSQRCVSVDVTIADDVGDRRQPWTSPVKASHGQTTSRAVLTARTHDATAAPSGRTAAERPRRDGPRRAPTPTSIVHLTVGPIHFGHSQTGLQAISEPEGERKAERWKTPAERLPTERTTSRTPRETTTGQRMRQTTEKRLPQAQASTGEPVRAIKQHLTPETVSYPEVKVKPDKQSDLTSLRAVDKDDFKSDQQTEKTRTQDTSLHSILKDHRGTEDGSKKQGKATKDGRGEAAETQEKRSKASESSKTLSGSGTKLSSPRDVSPTEPEGSSPIKQPSKRIAADEHKDPTKELPKEGADSDGTTGSTTAKTLESETGETASKTMRTQELGELDPDASAIERAQKQSLVRKERSEMGEKDLDDFRVGFELALSPYRVLVGLQPARPSSEDEEGTTKKGAKLPKGRKYSKNRRVSIVRIQKSDIKRKRKKGQIDTPSLLLEEAPQAAETGERAPKADHKKKRRRGKKSRGASQPPKKARKTATSTEGPSAVTAAASAATREGKISGAPDGSQLEPALNKKRSAHDSRRPSSEEPTSLRELEEEEEEEAKREKEKRKKKKRVKERKKKKRKKRKKRKHKKKRDRPIGYRSGNASCRVLCPVAIGLVFSVILLFMLLRALGYASPATFTATTVQPTFTFPALPTTTRTVPPPVPSPLPPVPPPVVPTAKPTPPPAKNVYVCPTETCKREGAYIATLLKSNSKPCDDLLDYVCDSWSRDHPVNPAGFGSFVSRGTLIQDALQRELLQVIRSAPDEDLKVVAGLHESCARRPPRASPLKFWTKMFKTWVIRTWPANPKAQTSDVWQFAAELLRDLGFSTLLAVTVGVGRKSPPQAVVELDRPELLFEEGDDRFDRVRAVIRGAFLELPISSIYPGSSQERANQTQDVIFNLARLPNDGRPYSTATQERWISVEFRELDGGLQYFLRKLFDNIVRPRQEPDVVLKSPAYILEGLVPFVNNAVPVHILNYMGFLVMVRLAPFLPGKKLDSRGLFAYSALGRSLPDVTDTSALCLLAVESLLPDCIAKAAAILRDRTDTDFGARDVLSV